MSEAALKGVFAALPVPFDTERQLDSPALSHLMTYLSARPIAGVALFAELSEDLLLGAAEREAILKLVSDQLKARALLVVVHSFDTEEALKLVLAAERARARVVLLAPPRLPGFGYRELYRHVDRIARKSKVALWVSARAGCIFDSLTTEEVRTLCKHPRLSGVFVPEHPPRGYEVWQKVFKDRSGSVFTASSLAFSRAAELGAHGAICGLAVLAADIAAAIGEGNEGRNRVQELETQVRPLVEWLGPPESPEAPQGMKKLAEKIARRSLSGPSLPPLYPPALLKEALRLQGHPIRADVRRPLEPVTAEATERLRGVLRVCGLL